MQELEQLQALGDAGKAAGMAAYHKAPRVYLGVAVPVIDGLAREWRAELDVPGRIDLASRLWDSDIHEARIAATKLLTQARIRPDEDVWRLIAGWVPQFDAWAIADHAMNAGERRLLPVWHPLHWRRGAGRDWSIYGCAGVRLPLLGQPFARPYARHAASIWW